MLKVSWYLQIPKKLLKIDISPIKLLKDEIVRIIWGIQNKLNTANDSSDLDRLLLKKDVYFSIVVPTYNRSHQLDKCLNFLIKQNFPLWKYEIIVIDDNSDDETNEVIKKYFKKFLNIKLVTNKKNKGPYYCRNLGAKISKAEIVVFTDDDCRFPSNWLLKIEKVFEKEEVVCVQGTQKYRGKTPGLEAEGEFYLEMLQKRKCLDTKNLAIRRNLILKYKFDEKFRNNGDAELGLRLVMNCVAIKYDPRIWIVHAPNYNFRDQIRRAKNWGKNLAVIHQVYGWKATNPRFKYPFTILLLVYLITSPYFLMKLRSIRGTIAFTLMLIIQGYYFKKSVEKMQ